ncbi:MAG: phage late control D family protein [Lachnospiraceae bacterium]
MGNLMNDRSKIEDLYKKYQGFQAPAAKILIGDGGVDLTRKLNAQIDGLNVTLSQENSGSVTFQIVNAYDYKNRKFNSTIMNQLVLGNLIKVQLGYGSSLEQVFTGYIYGVRAEFGESVTLSVTAMDVRRLMQDSAKSSHTWKYETYSEVFKQVMQPYKKLYSKLVVDKTADKSFEVITQNETDLEFVKKLCLQGNREFLVFDDVVYYRRKSKHSPSVTLSWGRDLISFSKESLYANQKITVVGLLKDGKEPVVSSAEVKTSEKIKPVVSGTSETTLASAASDSKSKAEEKAAKKAEEERKKKQSGQGTCVGLPQLIPGRPVAIAGMDERINGEYMLKSVAHSFGSDGFQTSFEIGGFE